MEVNGKFYPLWGQFVEKKSEFIGGVLEDHDNSFPATGEITPTRIKDIRLEPNGADEASFIVEGNDYTCAGSTSCLGVSGRGEPGWITLCGYGGHTWRFRKPSGAEVVI